MSDRPECGVRLRRLAGLFLLLVGALGSAASSAHAQERPGIAETSDFFPTTSVAACGTRQLPRERATPANPEALEELRAYSGRLGGAALIVMRGGNIIFEEYNAPFVAQTRTESASMHKSVLALAVGAAIDDGLIKSVDQPVGDFLTEWRSDPRGAIPLRHFLTMSSGLHIFAMNQGKPEAMQLLMGPDIDAAALATPLVETPGTVFAYANANSQIIGIVLSRAVQAGSYRDYGDYLSRRLWCPLGNAAALLTIDNNGSPRYYSSLLARPQDWARIGQLFLDKGEVGGRQIVPQDWLEAMVRPSPANARYGYQVWLGTPWTAMRSYNSVSTVRVPHSEPFTRPDLFFFDGFGGQRVYIIPSEDMVVVRTGEMTLQFDDATVPNLAVAAFGD